MNIKSFRDLVGDQVIALQSRARGLVDVSIGSILRSLAESNAGVVMWLQQLIVKLLVTTRASTCSGEDLDSWMADFGFYREAATAAVGQVVFGRFTASVQAVITIGTEVKTRDGSQLYSVVPDTGYAAFNNELNGYVMNPGVSTLLVPVRAIRAGSPGNALAGMVTVITGAIPFVDTVNNTSPMTGGNDAESDPDFRARFVRWIASLARGTRAALEYAISTVPGCRSWTLTENQTLEGLHKPGYFFAVVDNGSDPPSRQFIEQVILAIEGYRAFTIVYGVFPPIIHCVSVTAAISISDGAVKQAVIALIEAALRQYFAALRIGQSLSYTQLIRVTYAASPEVTNVTFMQVNGGTTDISVSRAELIKPGTLQVD